MTKKYNKLVRDKIPTIIEASGRQCKIHRATKNELITYLVEKLSEEVKEFSDARNEEEMADVLEVIDALIEMLNFDKEKIYKIKDEKNKTNGGFNKGIILEEVSEN